MREEDFRAPYLRSWFPGSMVPLGCWTFLLLGATWAQWKGLMLSIPVPYHSGPWASLGLGELSSGGNTGLQIGEGVQPQSGWQGWRVTALDVLVYVPWTELFFEDRHHTSTLRTLVGSEHVLVKWWSQETESESGMDNVVG